MRERPQVIPGARHLAIALDVSNLASALALAEELRGVVGVYKVGLQLFTSEGPAIVRALLPIGAVFLDLKLHDIPNTVEGAARAAAALGADYLTVHASGGRAMVEAAVRGAGTQLRVLAVTVLTSLSEGDVHQIGFAAGSSETATRLGQLALASGAHGLVSSAAEVEGLRKLSKSDFPALTPRLVVPGIRLSATELGDQRRVSTPVAAIRAGADLLVVGRPISEAADPRAAAEGIAAEIRRTFVSQP